MSRLVSSRLVSLSGEGRVKTQKNTVANLPRLRYSFSINSRLRYSLFINVLCIIILFALISQFCLEIKFFGKILYNWRKRRFTGPEMLSSYPINARLISPTTQVVFTESKRAGIPICVKVWQRQRVKADKATQQIRCLLEGFRCNQRWAPGIYLGMAYLETLSEDAQTFQRGRVTVWPRASKLEHGEYASIMKVLELDWRLDQRLDSRETSFATVDNMKFLAKEIARLHRRAKQSPRQRGLPASIQEKLDFNLGRYKQALAKLAQNGVDTSAYPSYEDMKELMSKARSSLEDVFNQRHDQHHIKRCHGDLKLTNLWIRPASGVFSRQALLALDCIDFNPDFYHIDTLSDVAMLAMDLQMHLQNGPHKDECDTLVETFIATYLQEAKEQRKSVATILQYYITEKAIVCAYVSILLDDDQKRGNKYLSLLNQQAKILGGLLSLPPLEYPVDNSGRVADTPKLVPTS